MDNLTKVLIIVVIILVAALRLASGFILQDYLFQQDITNQTNISVNNSSITNNQTTPEYISASRAIEITKSATAYYPDNRTRFTASFVDGERPYWKVEAWQNDPKDPNYGLGIGGAKVDAITGEILFAIG